MFIDMKAKVKTLLNVVILMLTLSFVGCLPDTELGPDPMEGSIIRFRITNNPEAIVAMQGKQIAITLPIGASTTGLIPEIIVSKGTTVLDYVEGQEMDFSDDVVIRVQGTDNEVINYLVKTTVKEPQPGFSSIDLYFETKFIDYGWPAHSTTSIAQSKGNLVVALPTLKKFQKLDANTGAITGEVAWPGQASIQQISNDSEGRLLALTLTTAGNEGRVYKWEDVNSQPEEFLKWTLDLTGPGNIAGSGLLSVKGDITKNAVIYTPAIGHALILRWTIKDGVLLSQTPEKINYVLPIVGNGVFPNLTPSVNALGPNPEDGFTVTAYTRGGSYVGPKGDFVFQASDYQGYTSENGAIRSYVFNFNYATYFVSAIYNSNISIFDITKPEGIAMDATKRFENGIEFKPFSSPTFPVTNGQPNISPYLGFTIKYNEDESAILYYLYANSGIRAYKLTPKK